MTKVQEQASAMRQRATDCLFNAGVEVNATLINTVAIFTVREIVQEFINNNLPLPAVAWTSVEQELKRQSSLKVAE